jgi:hypothetical protein
VNEATRLAAGAGLCGHCRNARVVESRRGSAFLLCELSRTDARYPRYPPLPVVRCDGFEDLEPSPASDRPDRPDR